MDETRYTASDFALVYNAFVPEDEGLREALTSTGNGYFCVRGSAEWEDASDVHYPGTYAHGVYNRESTVLGAYPVPNEDLVNLPRSGRSSFAWRTRSPCGSRTCCSSPIATHTIYGTQC